MLSCVLLANGEYISVYDLASVRLRADLIAMSACRTADGEITRGNDVLALMGGLLAAGARTVVATLWPVDDVAAFLFMSDFYRSWLTARTYPTRFDWLRGGSLA
ncbi:MAG TPA: CHAT domain-containing protein [Bryobacteraceae bacterium]|nr:CHAT domain-containing protein [Bryobacteraceae bacterium]